MPAPCSGLSFVLTAAGIIAAAGLCACAGGQASRAKNDEKAKATAAADKGADDLRQYIDQIDPIMEMDGRPEEDNWAIFDPPGNPGAVTSDAPPQIKEAPLASQTDTDGTEPKGTPPSSSDDVSAPDELQDHAAAPETPEAKLARQIGEVRQTIRELRTGGDSSSAEAVELLALHLLQTDAAEPDLDQVKEKLSMGQRRALNTLEQLLNELREGDGAVTALDARRLSRLLTEHADRLADQRPLRITSTALCTSVESYGCYTKFSDNTFLQGHAQPVIVYVALENFSQRAVSAARADETLADAAFKLPDAKEKEKKAATKKKPKPAPPVQKNGDMIVELTESIAIHNDSDDLVVWRAPEASIRDVSRDKRKDYYLVQRVELPARLTLGRYNLKVTVRDTATGATDETLIPIEIVADPAIASAK